MKDETEEMRYYGIMACKLGIMGIDDKGNAKKSFSPNEEVTRAQFGTILSRVLWGQIYSA
jgi:hypothetical protein